jgi:hypothetical protein
MPVEKVDVFELLIDEKVETLDPSAVDKGERPNCVIKRLVDIDDIRLDVFEPRVVDSVERPT